MAMTAAILESQRRAVAKAEALQWWRKVDQMTATTYYVDGSRRGVYYLVTRDGDRWLCECPAGQAGTPCYHASAAWHAWLRDQSGQQPERRQRPGEATAPQARKSDRGAIRSEEEEAIIRDIYPATPARPVREAWV